MKTTTQFCGVFIVLTAKEYALFYIIRDSEGKIHRLIQVRKASSSGTTPMLEDSVEYVYDPYGKLLEVKQPYNDSIGLYNPLIYKDYIYDFDTELYYLQSRYYDPEVGRFLNGDGYCTTGQGITDTNMFAYCGNNPICRVDPTGNAWEFIDELIDLILYGFEVAGILTTSTTSSHVPTQQEKAYAATVYAEAGGQNKRSKQAVAHVMNNRIGTRASWSDIESVISAKYQFDGYNSNMYKAAMSYYNNGICNNSIERAAMDECLAVVIPIYCGAEADITDGALYFHSFPNPSDWAYHNSYTQVYVSGTEKFWFYK